MVQGVIQTTFGDKFHNTLSMAKWMSVSVANLSSFAKVILENQIVDSKVGFSTASGCGLGLSINGTSSLLLDIPMYTFF